MRIDHKNTLRATALLALAFVGTAQAQISDDVVRIGVMADMTGPFSGNGGPGSVNAVRMAVDDFGGKVNGKPIEVVVADDQNKPDVGTSIARKWIESEKVDAIVGGSASSIALSVSSMMRQHGKPYLLAGTTSADLTGKACSPMNVQQMFDTYALTKSGVQSLIKQGIKTFYFIVVDYTFGTSMQEVATKFIEASGGKVLGAVRHPLGTTDFSSYLLQAQASKAQAIVLLNAGTDLNNALKQAAEYRLGKNGQVVTVFGMTINNITALGLDVAQGLQFTAPFYWDLNDETRAWSKRFMERNKGVVPTYLMANSYSSTMHYLKAVQATGTDEGKAVVTKMKATPMNDFSMKSVKIREDGRVMQPVYVVQVKAPGESKNRNDLYRIKGQIPAEEAFRPLSEGGCDFIRK